MRGLKTHSQERGTYKREEESRMKGRVLRGIKEGKGAEDNGP